LHPASESSLGSPWHPRGCTSSHEVFRPLSATQPSRATTPGLCLPGSRCVLALTMRLDALLPGTVSLVFFQPGALTGFHPSERDLTEIAAPLGAKHPLLRFAMPERRAFDAVAGATSYCPYAASLQGLVPLPVGASGSDITLCRRPGSPGFHPPWGFPPPRSRLRGRALARHRAETHGPATVSAGTHVPACYGSAWLL